MNAQEHLIIRLKTMFLLPARSLKSFLKFFKKIKTIFKKFLVFYFLNLNFIKNLNIKHNFIEIHAYDG